MPETRDYLETRKSTLHMALCKGIMWSNEKYVKHRVVVDRISVQKELEGIYQKISDGDFIKSPLSSLT